MAVDVSSTWNQSQPEVLSFSMCSGPCLTSFFSAPEASLDLLSVDQCRTTDDEMKDIVLKIDLRLGRDVVWFARHAKYQRRASGIVSISKAWFTTLEMGNWNE